MTGKRKKIPDTVDTGLLVKSRRRCCLCVGLNFDLSVKSIQRAHIDHDPSNNDLDNLAALCFEHHDQYDTKRRLSKNITEDELKYHRDRLYAIIAQIDDELELPRLDLKGSDEKGKETNSEDRAVSVLTSARTLGQILEAYDREVLRLDHKQTPTGQPIFNIGKLALEEGDFAAAGEATIALTRLATEYYANGGFRRTGVTGLPSMNPFTAVIRLLEHFILSDLDLYDRSVRRLRVFGMIEDTPIGQIKDYDELPRVSFDVVFTILYHVLNDVLAWGDQSGVGGIGHDLLTVRTDRRKLVESVARTNTRTLAELLMGLGLIMASKGIELPNLNSLPWISGTERLAITYESYELDDKQLMAVETVNFLKQACLLLLRLPEKAYKQFMQALDYRLLIILGTATDAKWKTVSLSDAEDGVRRWALLPGYGGVAISVKTDEERDPAQDLLRKTIASGKTTAEELKRMLLAKRPLDGKPRAPR